MKCFVCFIFCAKEEGWISAVSYDLLLQSGQARHSTFLSLDIKTFDNHAATDAVEWGKKRSSVHTHYAA